MASAESRGWGNPWTSTFRADNIVTVRIPHYGHAGHEQGIALPVHERVAPLFVGFLTEAQQRGYVLDEVADDWGYARRCVRGTGPGTSRPCVTSNHAWGLAVDINATRNPMGAPLRTDIPAWMVEVAAEYGLAWGGRWATPDPMHFEFTGSPGDADRLVSRTTRPSVTGPIVRPGPTYEDSTMQAHFVSLHAGGLRLDGQGRGYWDLPSFPFDRVVTVNPNVANPPEAGYGVPDVGFLRWGDGIRVVAEEGVAGGGLDVVVWTVGP